MPAHVASAEFIFPPNGEDNGAQATFRYRLAVQSRPRACGSWHPSAATCWAACKCSISAGVMPCPKRASISVQRLGWRTAQHHLVKLCLGTISNTRPRLRQPAASSLRQQSASFRLTGLSWEMNSNRPSRAGARLGNALQTSHASAYSVAGTGWSAVKIELPGPAVLSRGRDDR